MAGIAPQDRISLGTKSFKSRITFSFTFCLALNYTLVQTRKANHVSCLFLLLRPLPLFRRFRLASRLNVTLPGSSANCGYRCNVCSSPPSQPPTIPLAKSSSRSSGVHSLRPRKPAATTAFSSFHACSTARLWACFRMRCRSTSGSVPYLPTNMTPS